MKMNRQNKRSRLWRTGSISGGILLLILSGVLLISAEETDPADRRTMEEQEYTGNEPDNPEEADEEEIQMQISQIQCPEPDGQNGWYVTAPEIRIVHKEPGTVTRYRLAGTSGETVLEGELKLEEEEADRNPETEQKEEQREAPASVSDGFGDADGPAAVKEISPELLEEGRNFLEIRMISGEDGRELFCVEKEILLDLSPPEAPDIYIPVYPDGNGTFFHSGTEAEIRCADAVSGVEAIYAVLDGGEEQKIEGSRGSIEISPGYKGKISAWAVDFAGRKSRAEVSQTVLCEDKAPIIKAALPGGFGVWRQESAEIEIYVEDTEEAYGFASGLRSVTCYAGSDIAAEKKWEYGGKTVLSETLRFTVNLVSSGGSAVPVTVHVSDRSGNTAVLTEKIYIDVQPPSIEVTGVRDGMTAGKEKSAAFTLYDENILADCRLIVSKTGIDGKTEEILDASEEDWKGAAQKKQIEMNFSEDGKYVCRIYAGDASGRSTERTVSFTIDSTDPVIRYVEQLNGTYIPYFRWNYGKDMIRDLTDNTCSMFLNGRQYLPGTEITEEGIKLFEVRARDQAGNESSAEAVFTIDHTAPDICWGETQDGKTYREGVLLSVWVEGEGERIRDLYINGEKQRLNYESRIFQYEISGYGKYTVRVQAEDLAGNRSEESISFLVERERKGLAAFFDPVGALSGGYQDSGSGTESEMRSAVPVLIVICAGCVCLGMLGRRFREKKKNPEQAGKRKNGGEKKLPAAKTGSDQKN